jgi:hypothetical protein
MASSPSSYATQLCHETPPSVVDIPHSSGSVEEESSSQQAIIADVRSVSITKHIPTTITGCSKHTDQGYFVPKNVLVGYVMLVTVIIVMIALVTGFAVRSACGLTTMSSLEGEFPGKVSLFLKLVRIVSYFLRTPIALKKFCN